jgi:hypothetical protein
VIDQQSALALVEPWETVMVVPSSDPSAAFQAEAVTSSDASDEFSNTSVPPPGQP